MPIQNLASSPSWSKFLYFNASAIPFLHFLPVAMHLSNLQKYFFPLGLNLGSLWTCPAFPQFQCFLLHSYPFSNLLLSPSLIHYLMGNWLKWSFSQSVPIHLRKPYLNLKLTLSFLPNLLGDVHLHFPTGSARSSERAQIWIGPRSNRDRTTCLRPLLF